MIPEEEYQRLKGGDVRGISPLKSKRELLLEKKRRIIDEQIAMARQKKDVETDSRKWTTKVVLLAATVSYSRRSVAKGSTVYLMALPSRSKKTHKDVFIYVRIDSRWIRKRFKLEWLENFRLVAGNLSQKNPYIEQLRGFDQSDIEFLEERKSAQ